MVRTEPRPRGFYTVRFVEATSEEEAAAQVVAMVQAEVKTMYRDDNPEPCGFFGRLADDIANLYGY